MISLFWFIFVVLFSILPSPMLNSNSSPCVGYDLLVTFVLVTHRPLIKPIPIRLLSTPYPIDHHHHPPKAKGRTNIELREQFILADGVSQSMAAFKPRMSTPGSHHGSPSPVPMSSQGPITKVTRLLCKLNGHFPSTSWVNTWTYRGTKRISLGLVTVLSWVNWE